MAANLKCPSCGEILHEEGLEATGAEYRIYGNLWNPKQEANSHTLVECLSCHVIGLPEKFDERYIAVEYTVRRVRSSGKRYGSFHGSLDGEQTLCGEKIGRGWWIEDNDGMGTITCTKCLNVLGR